MSDAGLSSASIEIAAGSRHFSDGCEKAGWQAYAHDIIFDDKQDLRSPAYVQQQCDAAERGCYAIGHVGVCCTTFSRLANPPYRRHTDAAHPEFIVCLPDMSEKKTRKALEANLMADHSVTLLVAWHCSGMMASLENPHSSMIWQYFEHTGAMSRLQALGFRKFSTCYCRFGAPYKNDYFVYAITMPVECARNAIALRNIQFRSKAKSRQSMDGSRDLSLQTHIHEGWFLCG